MQKYSLFFILIAFLLQNCETTPSKLPILGERDFVNGDTVYHHIPAFSFVNQDSQLVTKQTYANKTYIVDFFFTSCPTICPKVTKNMLRVYEKFKRNDQVMLLSHTIDPKRDNVARLKLYAKNLSIEAPKWNFVTGQKDSLYRLANDYFSVAKEDPDSPGGFDHSGRLILVDKNGLVRGFCDGTDAEAVDKFMLEVERLLKE
ncbi:MAG: hypothetical protein RLZZ292_1140 [Bacteroidota bacterium]|jgi:protein SCO1/2